MSQVHTQVFNVWVNSAINFKITKKNLPHFAVYRFQVLH